MTRARQTIVNRKDGPIYVSIEPFPDCYELEPGERLTLIHDLPEEGDAPTVDFINDRELVVWPTGDPPAVFINGEKAERRSWKFKHR